MGPQRSANVIGSEGRPSARRQLIDATANQRCLEASKLSVLQWCRYAASVLPQGGRASKSPSIRTKTEHRTTNVVHRGPKLGMRQIASIIEADSELEK